MKMRLALCQYLVFAWVLSGSYCFSQTTKGYNPWWTCPDCGAQYRTEDYRIHRATAHNAEQRYTPETRRKLLGIPDPPPPPPPVRVIIEDDSDSDEQQMSVSYTPAPEPQRQEPVPPPPKLSDRIPGSGISLGTVKSILAEYGLTVEDASRVEIRAYKENDKVNSVRAEHRKDKNQIMFTKLYSFTKGTEDLAMLDLVNQLNAVTGDVHCRRDKWGDDLNILFMSCSIPIREGVTKAEVIEGYNNMQKALALVTALDKKKLLSPVTD